MTANKEKLRGWQTEEIGARMAANKSSCTDGKEKKIVPTAKKNKDSGPDQEEYTMVVNK